MSKQPMLDMFKRVLPAADRRDKEFYNNLTEEERKGFSSWLVMRYLSSAESANPEVIEHYLIMTNMLVNKNFSDLKEHPELLWKLMSVVGIGVGVKHPYVAPGKGRKRKGSAFKQWLADQYPHLSEEELTLWYSNFTKESARDLIEQFQIKDKDIIAAINDL